MYGRADRFHLGHAYAFGRVGNLALQIGHVHDVVVDDGDAPHTCRAQIECGRRAQAAGSNDHCMRRQNALLAFDADLVEHDVTGIA
jgi:hypothetical protein